MTEQYAEQIINLGDWPRMLIAPNITVVEICAAMATIRCDVIYGETPGGAGGYGLRVERKPKSPRRRKDKDPKP